VRSYDLLNAINESLSNLKPGSLSFWGDWFGKPYDNVHRITSATWTEDYDVIHFDGGETLLVKSPGKWSLKGGCLLIRDAEVVRWQWFSYGRVPSPETLQFIEYRRVGDRVEASASKLDEIPRTIDSSKPAVELHA
jgi:hypothetical protein